MLESVQLRFAVPLSCLYVVLRVALSYIPYLNNSLAKKKAAASICYQSFESEGPGFKCTNSLDLRAV
jgi:hypothetical protein